MARSKPKAKLKSKAKTGPVDVTASQAETPSSGVPDGADTVALGERLPFPEAAPKSAREAPPLPPDREVELTLLIGPEQAGRVGRLAAIRELAAGRAKTRTLRSIYYDSSDSALKIAGFALRLRSNGQGWVQTVKGYAGRRGAASDRFEASTAIEGPGPEPKRIKPKKWGRRVAALEEAGALHPVFETEIRRAERHLVTKDKSEIALAVDQGIIRALGSGGLKEVPVCEVELELTGGQPAALFQLAHLLAEDLNARISVRSKAARGYDLAAAREPVIAKQHPPPLNKDMTAETAFRVIFGETLRHLLENQAALWQCADPKAVHQSRVALRRFRSAVKLVRRDAAPLIQALAATARQLAGEFGPLRDLHVFRDESLAPVLGANANHPGCAALAKRCEEAEGTAWDRARAAAGAGVTGFALDLSLVLESGDPLFRSEEAGSQPIKDVAPALLTKAYGAAEKLGRKLEKLDTEQRHDLRKRLKTLRYAGEFFGALYTGAAARSFTKRLKALQDDFGVLNDVAVATEVLDMLEASGPANLDRAKALALSEAKGLILGWRQQDAARHLDNIYDRWAQFADVPPYWT